MRKYSKDGDGLIRQYISSGKDPAYVEAIVGEYQSLVKSIATSIAFRLPPHVDLDDSVSAGKYGFLLALKKYSLGYNATFETFASIRIRGAILDELREMDFVPKSLRAVTNRVADYIEDFVKINGKNPSYKEIKKEFGFTDKKMREVQEAIGNVILSLNNVYKNEDGDEVELIETIEQSVFPSPNSEISKGDDISDIVNEEIDLLNEREQSIMRLHYLEECTLKEIGEVFGVSESRISQIHTEVIQKLKERLRNQFEY